MKLLIDRPGSDRLGAVSGGTRSALTLAASAFATMALLAGPAPGASASSGVQAQGSAAETPANTRNLIYVGKSSLAAPLRSQPWRRWSQPVLLVPVNYPLEVSGRKVRLRTTVRLPGGKTVRKSVIDRPHGGNPRTGDRRTTFRFVHVLRVNRPLSLRLLKRGSRVGIDTTVTASLFAGDVSRGEPLFRGSRRQASVRRAPTSRCSTAPLLLRQAGGDPVLAKAPRCGVRTNWTVDRVPDRGAADVSPKTITFSGSSAQLGSDSFRLLGRLRSGGRVYRTVQVRSSRTAADSISVRAMGDSVTAGFGYFGKTGRSMPITDLLRCRPGATVFNDACSSNSSNRNSSVGTSPDYLPDYGLSRNISWAAQWANEYGITDYRNYAVTGSAPNDWLPGGQFHSTLLDIQQQNPDYVVMTMGANPLLSDMLFGIDNMGCAVESDLFGDYRACIEAAFASIDLAQRLNDLYTSLVNNTSSQIVLMQYHLSVPSTAIAYSATQIELMGELLNQVIADQAAAVSTDRIAVVAPPRFDVGIDMEPLYPSKFSCSWAGFEVDGPSVQSDPTQDELLALHPLSFCEGPAVGPPWVISGDTGIHPSAAGYSQMAGRMPAPE